MGTAPLAEPTDLVERSNCVSIIAAPEFAAGAEFAESADGCRMRARISAMSAPRPPLAAAPAPTSALAESGLARNEFALDEAAV